jgi:two-component system response regulator PilR (NtrC family)
VATHRDLEEMSRRGTFRSDLYFRLAQVVVRIPPLRERTGDIALLAQRFLRAIQGRSGGARVFSEAAVAVLSAADFPGNVRELRNIVERACTLARGSQLEPADLALPGSGAVAGESRSARPEATPSPDAAGSCPPELSSAVERAEREAIERALKAHFYHRTRAAEALGISLPTLRARIRRFGIWMPGRSGPRGEG